MAEVRPIREGAAEPLAMHSHAIDNLRYIRETMERAGSFTAVPGWGGIVMGATAIIAAILASRMPTPEAWFAVWMVEAALAFVVGSWSMISKEKTARVFLKGPGRIFA